MALYFRSCLQHVEDAPAPPRQPRGQSQSDRVRQGLAGHDRYRPAPRCSSRTRNGGWGIDYLDDGRDNDTLTGDLGADRFVFGKSGGSDTVTDFQTTGTDHDWIVLEDGIMIKSVTLANVDGVGPLDTVVQFSSGSATFLGTGDHPATVAA